jgi:hypothetical protein
MSDFSPHETLDTLEVGSKPPPSGHWQTGTSPAKTLDDLTFEAPPSKASDIAKTVGSQFGLGIAADIPATPTIPSMLYGVVKSGVQKAYDYGRDVAGLLPEGETYADVQRKRTAEEAATTPEAVKSGDFAQIGTTTYNPRVPAKYQTKAGQPVLYPTSQFLEREAKATFPSLDYEPFYNESKYAGSAARFAGSAAIGPFTGAAKRVGMAAISGLASEVAGQAAAQNGYEDYENAARIVGSFAGLPVGYGLAKATKWATMTGTTAREELAKAIGEDLRTNEAAMTSDQLQEAYQNGLNPMVYDMAGPRTRAILKKYGMDNALAQEYMGELNKNVEARAKKADLGFGKELETIMGAPIDPVNVTNAEKRIGADTRSKLYKFIEATPEAQAVKITPDLNELNQSDTMKKVFAQVESHATDPDSNIVIPQVIKGTPAVPQSFPATERGIVEVKAKAGTPDKIIPANLAYYDEAKKVLDGMISTAADATKPDMAEVARLQKLKNQLTTSLDKAVPGYEGVRDKASETFMAASAPQAGYNFMKNMDIFKADELAQSLNKYTKSQRADFASGSAAYLRKMLNEKGIDAVADFMNKEGSATRLKLALGNDAFDDIYGRVQSQALMAKADTLKNIVPSAKQSTGESIAATAKSAAAGGLLGYFSMLSAGKELNAGDWAHMLEIIGAGAGAAGGAVINAREAAIGQKIMKLAQSTDPNDWRQIGKMARENKAASGFLSKMSNYFDGAGLNLVRAAPPPEYATRPERASGGSVIDKKADALVNETMRNKKLYSDHTEHMLSMPDDAIVQALNIAKQVAS